MWIRSQDGKQLIKGKKIFTMGNMIFIDMLGEEISSLENMGDYCSEERAIEVVERIYSAIKDGKNIYSMPEK